MKESLTIIMFGLLLGCSTVNSETPNAQAVSKMSKEALKQCGKGNVKSVSIEGYVCKSSEK
jgi:hypothetical protein